jgi:TPR repeat protein
LAGDLVTKDIKKALEYLDEASEAGHSLAANELGVIYLNGMLEQKPDGKKALEMFTHSAELGNPEAMKNIAVMYKDGLSRDKEPATALKWYLIAQSFGYKAADINQIIDALKQSVKEAEAKKAEEEATKWAEEVKAELAEKAEDAKKK